MHIRSLVSVACMKSPQCQLKSSVYRQVGLVQTMYCVYEKIDTVNAKRCEESDSIMIRSHIKAKMIEQKVAADSASVEEALRAFSRVLKLLLILRPTHYSTDITDSLARVPDRTSYQLDTVLDLCIGGPLICVVGDFFGEGKSTIAAALVERGGLVAYHFCVVKADTNRQD